MDSGDIEAVQAAFKEWDIDGNGTISRSELTQALSNLGIELNKRQLTRLIQNVTTHENGEMDYKSLLKWIFMDDSPSNKCENVTRAKVRESLGIQKETDDEEEDDGEEEAEEEEGDDDADEEEEGDDEEDEDGEEDDEENEEDEEDATQPPSSNTAGRRPRGALNREKSKSKAKARRREKANTKPKEDGAGDAQAELNKAAEEINRLKADLERKEKAQQEAESKAKTTQQQAEMERQQMLEAIAAAERKAEQVNSTEAPQLSESGSLPPAASPTPKAKKKKEKENPYLQEEGVVCVQEIQMGEKQQVRSALGVGNEVWTIDWGGMVSVRSRHNAQDIKAEIRTNRFVTSMLHIQPSLMWLGQEQQGISIIDSRRRRQIGSLTGGHSSLISCLCVDEANLGDEGVDGVFPARRAWSGSDDFTIRQWHIQTWRAEASQPAGIIGDATIVETDGFKTAISKGLQLHGHKNKVRCMLKMGPYLWTGSDDGTIRIWNCADSLCYETIFAHRDGVLNLCAVRSFVWSGGTDGSIREWSNHLPDGNGTVRECQRSVAPEGSEKGVYGLLPLGQEVWTCGHNPNIQVFDQQSFDKLTAYEAHKPYVSKLIPVDRMVTKTVWTTSFADRKLKVWSHVVRDDDRDTDVLLAENKLYVQSERDHAGHLEELARKLNENQAIIHAMGLGDMDPETAKMIAEKVGKLLDGLKDLSPEDQANMLDKIAGVISGLSHLSAEDMATALDKVGKLLNNLGKLPAEQMAEALDQLGKLVAALDHLPPEKLVEALEQVTSLVSHLSDKGLLDVLGNLPAVVDAFNDLGLKRLLKNPDALKRFLQAFVNQGMEHLIDDPEKMEAILKIFNDLNAKGLLDGDALNAYLQNSGGVGSTGAGGGGDGGDSEEPELKRVLAAGKELADLVAQYKDLLEAMGIGDILSDPSQLRKLFETLQQLRSALEENGYGDFLKNPKGLADFLANYNKVKAAFEEYGLGELVEDPYSAKGWLRNYAKIQQAFKDAGLEYLLSSAGAMKDFLAKHAAAGAALQDMGDISSRLSQLENELQRKESALQRANAENEQLKKSLSAYEELGTVDQLKRMKNEMVTLAHGAKNASALQSRVTELERELANKEQERLDALAREKVMFTRYKELDIFKLDIIARELKGVLKKVELTEKRSKELKDQANRFKDYGERKHIEGHSNGLIDGCRQTEAHIHDVILKCFSETQRRHIGVATDNEYRADDRRDGRLLDGGTMLYSVEEEAEIAAKASLAHVHGTPDIERPDYGSSRAAPLYRSDALKRGVG